MAQPVASGAVVELRMYQRLFDQVLITTMHYYNKYLAIPTADGDNEINNLMTNWYNHLWDPAAAQTWGKLQSSDVTYEAVVGQVVEPARQYYLRQNMTVNPVGTASAPSQVSASLTLRNDVVGRGRVGGIRIGGIPKADIDGDYLTMAAYNKLVNVALLIADPLQDIAGTDRWYPIIWSHRYRLARNEIIGWIAHQDTRAMQRRVVGHGI